MCYPAPLVFLVVRDCGPHSLQQDGAPQSITTAPAIGSLLSSGWRLDHRTPLPLEGKRNTGKEPRLALASGLRVSSLCSRLWLMMMFSDWELEGFEPVAEVHVNTVWMAQRECITQVKPGGLGARLRLISSKGHIQHKHSSASKTSADPLFF